MSTKAFKNDKIALIKEKIDKAQVAIVTEYKGLSVEEITKLRRALQKDGGDYVSVPSVPVINLCYLVDNRSLYFRVLP